MKPFGGASRSRHYYHGIFDVCVTIT